MKGVEAIARILQREGVEVLFAYPANPLIDAAAAVGIRPDHGPHREDPDQHGGRLRPGDERAPAGGGHGAGRAGDRERLRRRGPGLRQFRPPAAPAGGRGPGPAGDADGVRPPAPLRPRDQVGRPRQPPGAHPGVAAPGLHPAAHRAAGPRAAGGAVGRGGGRGGRGERPGRTAGRVPAGPGLPLGRRPGGRHRGGAPPAAGPRPAAPRRPRRAVGRGLGRAARAGRAARGAGDDHHGREERLPRGSPPGGRHRGAHHHRHRGPPAGDLRPRPRRRLQLLPGLVLGPHPRREDAGADHQRRAGHLQGLPGGPGRAGRRQAGAAPADRGGAPAGRGGTGARPEAGRTWP